MSDDLDELLESLGRGAWHRDAACREHPNVSWFPERGEPVDRQLQVCGRCLVRVECLEHALAEPERVGIWGGHSQAALRSLLALRKRRSLADLPVEELERRAGRHPSQRKPTRAA